MTTSPAPCKTSLRIAATLGFAGVLLGALGAHGGVHDILVANDRLANWQTAVFYQLLHTVVLYVLATRENKCGPSLCFLAGIILFSGSLYVLSLTNVLWLGAITPLGGLAFLSGWLWLAIKG